MQGSKVMHQSRAGTLAPEEPDELIAHVRVCGGAGWVTTGSTRKPTPNSLRSYLAPAIGRGSPRALGVVTRRKETTPLRLCHACVVVPYAKESSDGHHRGYHAVPKPRSANGPAFLDPIS